MKHFFFKAFWGTIIFLLIVYAGVMIYLYKDSIFQEENLTKELITKVQENTPSLIKLVQDSTLENKQKVKELIDKEITIAYKPLYDQIDDFTTFHYSLRGEYSEIYYSLTNQFDELLHQQLFEPANFDQNLKKALERINRSTYEIINSSLTTTKTSFGTVLGIDENATAYLFNDLLKFSIKDMVAQYEHNFSIKASGAGAGGGAIGGAILGKVIAKKLSQKTLLKGSTKIGAKILMSAEGAVSTSTVGALGGPLGAFLGGVVGAIGGWMASDAAIIAADKKLNAQEFKKELEKLILQQEQQTKDTLYKIYLKNLEEMEQNLTNQIETTR